MTSMRSRHPLPQPIAPENLRSAFEAMRAQSAALAGMKFRATGLNAASGAALSAHLRHHRTRAQDWAINRHAHLGAAAAEMDMEPSLFGGLAGLVFAAKVCAKGQPAYGRLAARAASHFASVGHLGSGYVAPRRSSEFDLVTGAAGMSIALEGLRDSIAFDAKRRIDDYLAWLCNDRSGERWRAVSPIDLQEGVAGINLGMAHGIAGVLAALCGNGRPEHDDAIALAADFLLRARNADGSWPAVVLECGTVSARVSWCYGTPGIAAALAQAGVRLNSRRLLSISKEALRGALFSRDSWHLGDYAICHGLAGIALSCFSVARRTHDSALLQCAKELSAEIENAHDDAYRWGYRSRSAEGEPYDDLTLLTGVVGIALTIDTVLYDGDMQWMRALAL